jgi:glycosyltransferase involved in cell wall biosynthesis
MSSGKPKVMFFTSSLGGGGAERHLVNLVNSIDLNYFEIELVLARRNGSLVSMVRDDVRIEYLTSRNIPSVSLQLLASRRALQNVIEEKRPALICAVLDHASLLLASILPSLSYQPKVIFNVQNPPRLLYGNRLSFYQQSVIKLIAKLYPRADAIVALSKGVAEDYACLVPGISDKISVIGNAVVTKSISERYSKEEDLSRNHKEKTLISCGRLVQQKNLGLLIDAFKIVSAMLPVKLQIVGDGPKKAKLQKKVAKLKLTNKIEFLGFNKNPYDLIKQADALVVSSKFEGLCNAIIEAMAIGVPVVAVNCPVGPAELIDNKLTGLLSESSAIALAKSIVELLQIIDAPSQVKIEQMIEKARHTALRYDSNSIAIEFQNLFLSLLNQSNQPLSLVVNQ